MTPQASQANVKGEGEMDQVAKTDLAIARIEAAPVEELAETLDALESLKNRVKELDACAKRNMTARIQATGGKAIVIGTDVWQLKRTKKVKCKDVKQTYETALSLAGGDIEAMVRDYFASDAFKYGSIREALNDPAKFGELFEETVDTTSEKKLTKTNTKFIR